MLFRPLLVKWPCSDANCGSAAATRWKRTNWLSTKHVLARVFSQTSSSNRNRNWNRWERDGVWHTDPIPGFDFLVFLKNTRFPLHKHTHKRTRERKRQSGQTSCMAKNFRLAFFIFPASDIHPPPPKSNPLFCHQENSPLAASSLEIFLIASKLRRFHRLPYVTSYVRGDTVYSYSLCVSLIFLVMNVYPRYDAFVYMYLNIQYSISISITSVMNKNQKTKNDGMMGWWDLAWYSLGFFCNLIICSSFFSDI